MTGADPVDDPDDLALGPIEIAPRGGRASGLPGQYGAAADDDAACQQRGSHCCTSGMLPLSTGPRCWSHISFRARALSPAAIRRVGRTIAIRVAGASRRRLAP